MGIYMQLNLLQRFFWEKLAVESRTKEGEATPSSSLSPVPQGRLGMSIHGKEAGFSFSFPSQSLAKSYC